MIKKSFALFLCFCLAVLSAPVANAQENQENTYKNIRVRYSDHQETTELLSVMIVDDNVYANAEQLGKRLGYQVGISDEKVSIYNREESVNIPYGLTEFYFGSTKVKHMLFTRMLDSYEAPFSSVKNDQGAWIPLEYTLLMLNSSMLVVDDTVSIDMPEKNIIDIYMDVLRKQGTYLFDWGDDFGYTQLDWMTIGANSHLINLFNGLLKQDGDSWLQFIQMLAMDSSAYDKKYGEDIAMLFCTQSDDEISSTIEKMKDQLQFITEDGALGQMLSALEKQEQTDVQALYQACIELKNRLDGSNSKMAVYNRAYQALEDACDEATWFSETGGEILRVQREVSAVASWMDTIFTVAEVVGYGKEFQNQDDFSVNALKNFVQKTDVESVMSDAMKDSMADYMSGLETDLLTYSASRYLEEHVVEWVSDAMDLSSAIGTEGTLALIAWDLASGNIPFISNGIDAADQFELALYASLMQSDAGFAYREMRDSVFAVEDALTPENLYQVSEACYTFLKACYITREAAVASLTGKTDGTKEQIQPLIDYQKSINQEIADYLVDLRDANETNENLCYGFLPEDNEEYLQTYEPAKFVECIDAITVTGNDDSEQLYAEVLDMFYYNISTGWENYEIMDYYNDFISFIFPMYYSDPAYIDKIGYQFWDLDGNGIKELLIGTTGDYNYYETMVIDDLYTYVDGEIIHLASSGERWKYCLCADRSIYYDGSGGAAYTMWIQYYLPYNGKQLMGIESVYTDTDNVGNMLWYYTTDFEEYEYTEEYFPTEKSSLEISEDRAHGIMDQWPDVVDLELTMFSEYVPQNEM